MPRFRVLLAWFAQRFPRTRLVGVAMRWCDVLLLGFVTGALWLSLRWVFADSLDRLQAGVEQLSELHPWSVRLTLLGIVILLLGTAQHLIQVRRRHLALLPCYPPTWLAAALGVAVVAALGLAPVIPGATSWRDALGVWLHLGLLVAAALGVLWLYSSLSQRHLASLRGGTGLRPAAPSVAEASLPPRLRPWLTPEQPVTSADHDALSRQAVADRLAVVLRQPATRTIGLIGGFGAGKSSVLSLLQRRLEDRSDASATPIWYCQVSCWGFDDTSAAIDRVLSAAIERIEREIDCLAVRDLPKSYLDAFVVVHKALKPLLSAFHGSHDAKKTLRRLDSLLAIAGARLVIAMEDIERNGKLDTLQFQALLDNLRSMQNVTFILVAVTASALDFTRLCDHVESLPNLPPEDVWDWLIDYRDHLVQSRPRIVDPVAPKFRLRKTPQIAGLSDPLARQAGALLATPRLLKRAMQRFRRGWDAVGGEVDVDDLLVLAILRTTAPSAVDFLQDNVGRIRTAIVNSRSAAPPIGEGGDATLHALQRQWEACGQRIAASNDAVDLGAVEALVDFLVPGLGPGFKNPRGGRPPAPQGVLGADHCDYWRRAYDERVDSPVKDQEILADYHRLSTGSAEAADLAATVTLSDDHALVYANYLDQCDVADRRKLVAAVISRIAEDRQHAPSAAHFAFQRMFGRFRALAEPGNSDDEWILARLNEAARRSLGFANQLFERMAGRGGMLAGQESADALRASWVEDFRQLIGDGAIDLAAILSDEHPAALRHLVLPPDSLPPNRWLTPTDVADWTWLAPHVIDAMMRSFDVVSRQVIQLVTDQAPRRDVPALGPHHLNRERFQTFFGERAPEVAALLATPDLKPNHAISDHDLNQVQLELQELAGASPIAP